MDIRPYQSADREPLLAFLRKQFPGSPLKGDGAYFDWRFADNPLGSSLDNYWLAAKGDQIIGQMGTIRDRVRLAGEWCDAAWLVDLIVAPEHRGGLAALRLFQAFMRENRLLLTSGANPSTSSLYKALGWKLLRLSRSFYYPIRPGRVVRQASRSGSGRASRPLAIAAPLLALADLSLPAAHRLAGHYRSTVRNGELTPLDESLDGVQTVVDRVAPRLGATTWRNRELLDWKLNRRPVGSHFGFVHRATDGEPAGYMVAKPMRRAGGSSWVDVVDYLAAPDDAGAFRLLLGAVQAEALRRGVDAVRLRASLPAHIDALRRPWWIERTSAVTDEVYVWSPDDELMKAAARDPWHVTAIVSDRVDYGRDDWPDNAD